METTITTKSIEQHHLFEVHHSMVGSLMSLDQWNERRRLYWEAVADRVHHPEDYTNGLKCPKCFNGNLYDTGQVLRARQLRVKCTSCDFKGERLE